MSKTKDSGYLFAKMSPTDENGVGHIVITEKDSKTYHFDEGGKDGEKQSLKKWILDNVMLLVTLTGVLLGIMTGSLIELLCMCWRHVVSQFVDWSEAQMKIEKIPVKCTSIYVFCSLRRAVPAFVSRTIERNLKDFPLN